MTTRDFLHNPRVRVASPFRAGSLGVTLGHTAQPNRDFALRPICGTPDPLPRQDGGICVDAQCRALLEPLSSDGDGKGKGGVASTRPVYAAGDVAAFPLALEGSRRVRQEHVQNAR